MNFDFDDEGRLVMPSKGSVKLNPYAPRPFLHREYLTDDEILSNVGKVLFVDVELYNNYYLCSFKLHGTNKFAVFESGPNRQFNNRKLSWLLHNYVTIGFNSIKYDLPMIWLSYACPNVRNLKDASNDLIVGNLRTKDLQDKYGFKVFKTDHIDLIEVAPLKGSLKLYGARLHSPRIQDLPFPDTKELTEEEIEIVKQYNFNDLDVTEQLFDFMKERLELRQALSAEYGENLMSKSDAQIAEAVLAKEVGKLNGARPKRPTIAPGTTYAYSVPPYISYYTPQLQRLLEAVKSAKFVVGDTGKISLPDELKSSVKLNNGEYRLGIGGLHSSEETVSYVATDDVAIVDRDVASYYPRLITTLGLYPISMGPAFLTVYEKLIASRLGDKAAKRFTADKGKKIVINGASGKLSDFWSTLYSPNLTIQMTVTGQLALLMFIELLEVWCDIRVISANTDGIVSLVPKDKEELFAKCVHHWEAVTGFTTEETRYKSYYARDVNAYFAVKLDGSVKTKGPYSEVGSQSGTKLDTNPTVLICSDAVKALLSKSVPIEKTILECKDFTRFVTVRQAKSPGAHKNGDYLGKTLRWYYAEGETGSINTVSHDSKVADSDGGKPVMDLPTAFPADINYDWYIAKTNKILTEFGYLAEPKQLKFF